MTCFIVAEIGVNAGKSLTLAKKLINSAKKAGADAVKFQAWSKNRFPLLENLRMLFHTHILIKEYAESQGLIWFCTPFDKESIVIFNDIGMKIWKVPSGYIVEEAYLDEIAKIKPFKIIISSGRGNKKSPPTYAEIDNCLKKFLDCNDRNLLYCVSKYPAEPKDLNLKQLSLMAELFPAWKIGFSDHSILTEIPIAAVTLGANVIEKHLTYDQSAEGPDHIASLEPYQFEMMVKQIRNVEKALE